MSIENYMPKPAVQKNTMTEMMVGRQAQEVQAMVFMAKSFPRDQYAAFNRIMVACERKNLAAEAMYEYPRGNSKVIGPSIRLAEVIAQNWGNIDFGVVELEQKLGESKMMAYAWDLETNTRQTKIFNVRHEMSAHGSIRKLTDPRDIYELTANMGARRVRACILGVIPGDIIDKAMEKCQETIVKGHTEPLQDRIRKALGMLQKDFGVTAEMVEKHLGCKADAFSEHDYIRLGSIYRSLRDGMAKREDFFDMRVGHDVQSNAEKAFKQQMGGAKDESAATVDQSELPLE